MRLAEFALRRAAQETENMRIVYLMLGFFVLLNIGVACRTGQPAAENCTQVSAGLVHCMEEEARQHE